MYKTICVVLFVTRVVFVSLQSCQYLFNVTVNYSEFKKINGNKTYNTMITGCINDTVTVFEDIKGLRIWMMEENLPKLDKNFISNINNLKEIDMAKCHIETIEPGAFTNLPQLETINIHSNVIKTLSRGVFDIIPSLKNIQFYDNRLSYIEDSAFGNLPNLKIISLNDNELDQVKREWFTNTTNIESFNLFRNFVRKIPLGMFHGWSNLRAIYFSSNSISVIEGEMFKDNPSFIKEVNLHHNRLTSISLNTFPDSFYYGFLGVSGNLLNYLPEEFLNKIRVGNIGIYGNPFTCSCLEKNYRILLNRGVTVDDPVITRSQSCLDAGAPVCGLSLNSSSTCIESIDKELTKRFTSYIKKNRYDSVLNESGQQCFMIDEFD